MNLFRFRYVLMTWGAVFIASLLYINTQSIDIDKHNSIIDSIRQFKQVDAILNQQILETRQGLLTQYDPTVSNISSLEQLQHKITDMMLQLYPEPPVALRRNIESVHLALEQKKQTLETFKSSNAVLNNSLHYLPTATTQILDQLSYNKQNNVLRHDLNTLLRDIMVYSLRGSEQPGDRLNADISQLKQDFTRFPASTHKDLSILLAHVKIVLDHKKQLDALTQQLLAAPTSQHMNELLQVHISEYNRISQRANMFRSLLYGFSILLLIYIGYIWFRLNQTATRLQRTVTDLNYQKFAVDQHAIVSITDSNGAITYANQRFCDISHRSLAELIGKNHRIVKSGQHPPSFYKDMWDTISHGNVWHGQIQNRDRNDTRYDVDTTIVPFMDEENKPYQYVAIRTDITEIKKAEEQLRIQAMALRVAANGIVITDKNGIIEWVNDAYTQLTGYAQDEALGQTPRILKSGKQTPEFYQNLWRTILAGQVWHGELVNRRKDGSLYTEEQTISPVHDKQGNITNFITIKQDITERQQTEEALRRSQKMEAIGQLSGGIAHDFNNQLGIILGYLDFLKMRCSDDDKPRQWVETATKAALRCTDLTRQLLAFSRRQSAEKKVIDLNASLQELQNMIARSLTPEVKVQYFLADDLWNTEINAGEFQDVILNLAINARDAMPNGGELVIETCNTYLEQDDVELHHDAEAGDYVQLMLSDTGTGMDKTTLEHIFEPFFTTKPKDKGTGLGMAMVYGFVQRYRGQIKIYSKPRVGTTIRLYLPRSRASETAVIHHIEQQSELPTGNENILIVDDEADLLQLADQYLSDLGYQTYTAENPAQALKILAKNNKIDLLFSDVVMPGGTNGYELARQATEHKPELKVLLTSGFTSKTVDKETLSRFSGHLLSKPYRKAEMARRIRQELDEKQM